MRPATATASWSQVELLPDSELPRTILTNRMKIGSQQHSKLARIVPGAERLSRGTGIFVYAVVAQHAETLPRV